MIINKIGSQYNFQAYQINDTNSSTSYMLGKSADDSINISSQAHITGLLTKFMDGAGADGVIDLDEIRAFRDKRIKMAQTQLHDTLNNLNIHPSGRLRIDIDPSNKVIVSGGSAEENSAIAVALQGNDEFINTWHAASGTSSMLAAAEASTPFQNAYRLDRKSAVDQYSWLFNKEWKFNMYFEKGIIDYSVI